MLGLFVAAVFLVPINDVFCQGIGGLCSHNVRQFCNWKKMTLGKRCNRTSVKHPTGSSIAW